MNNAALGRGFVLWQHPSARSAVQSDDYNAKRRRRLKTEAAPPTRLMSLGRDHLTRAETVTVAQSAQTWLMSDAWWNGSGP